ncbi:hypothetical protein FJV46_05540 [Arthrobacter agilis]|uniref:hypothetical protein n=1 Tax=Arthrobacter agilis TaxID=37921 RepID=UPI000F7E1455|nr:hypothetical protein [Arthrobacter agilis]TPV26354.1 hypothetical protein FJV46_05540 [Arthrobacter agilis]WDF33395.1 hypothetical protein PTW37_00150 [Arthrobacter agilis]
MTPPAAGHALEWDEPSPDLEGSSRPFPAGRSGAPAADLTRGLQARINSMQAARLDSRLLPTVPALARILPGGGIQSGGSYAVRNSATLAMALLAGPSATGAWCSVIGMPDFSVEAAQGLGINLERLILVPDPGSQWLTVTAALVDVVSIVLTRAPEHLAPTEWARLKARLRQRGAALITLGAWKQSDSTLGVAESAWEGLGSGTGHLRARRMKITATQPSGRLRHAYVGLADLQGVPADGSPLSAPHTPPAPHDIGSSALFEPQLVRSS